jgi:hypothetical protein
MKTKLILTLTLFFSILFTTSNLRAQVTTSCPTEQHCIKNDDPTLILSVCEACNVCPSDMTCPCFSAMFPCNPAGTCILINNCSPNLNYQDQFCFPATGADDINYTVSIWGDNGSGVLVSWGMVTIPLSAITSTENKVAFVPHKYVGYRKDGSGVIHLRTLIYSGMDEDEWH